MIDEKQVLRRLQDLEAIRQLKAQYCRYVDTKRWQDLLQLFTATARFEGFGSVPDGVDAAAFVQGVSRRLEGAISVHQCHQPEIQFLGEGAARGIWAMQDYLQWPPEKQSAEQGFMGWGYYEEAYVRDSQGWKMERVRLTRLRVDALPIDHPFPCAEALRAPSPDWLCV